MNTHGMRGQVHSGMTIIEVAVWVGVFTMAMLALTQSLLFFYKVNRYTLQDATAIASAQHGMDAVVRALRTASYSNVGAYPIISIAPNQISFYANVIKNDPLIQQVRFFVQGTSLFEGIIEPSGNPLTYASSSETITTLSNYVQNAAQATTTFFYYDQNGAPISNFTNVSALRYVTVSLIVDVSTTTSPNQLNLISSAALRNLVTH